MGAKRSMLIFVSFFFIAVSSLGFVIEAKAETMKCRTAAIYLKEETMSLGDLEDRSFGMSMREGLAFFENGEIANFKNYLLSENQGGGIGQSVGYNFFTFEDGSRIIVRLVSQTIYDPSGARSSKSTSEIIKGEGRFDGIKGTTSSTVKAFPLVKGEYRKSTSAITFTYTLPPK